MDGVANGAARCAICKSIICSRAVRSVMTQRRISSPYAPGVTDELIFYSETWPSHRFNRKFEVRFRVSVEGSQNQSHPSIELQCDKVHRLSANAPL